MRFSSSIMFALFTSFSMLTLSSSSTFDQEHKQQLRASRQAQAHNTQHRYLNAREEEKGVFVVESSSFTTEDDDQNEHRQRQLHDQRRSLIETCSCKLYQEDVYYHVEDLGNGSEDKWACTFENYYDGDSGTSSPYPHTVDIEGYNIKQALKQVNAISGQSYLHWSPTINDVSINNMNAKLTVNVDITTSATIWIDTPTPTTANPNIFNRRNLQLLPQQTLTTGVKKTLVVRVVGNGIGPAASRQQLYDDIYGPEKSLKSQMSQCSGDKLTIVPFSGSTGGALNAVIDAGVVELRITTNPNGKTDKQMENDANAAAAYVFGKLFEQFDLVLFAMPPGIKPGFAAYAYIGSPFSYYSDISIQDVMVQMHEVGHNIGLQHAGQGAEEYGDKSGYMGYSPTIDPRMCYNAANNYQLGWYSQYSIRPTASDGYGGKFTISGVAGYNKNDQTKFVSLRLEQKNLNFSYYIGYNWAFGANTETQEDANKLVIVQKAGDASASEISWKKAALSLGESYVIDNYDVSGRSVTVTFARIDDVDAVVDVIPEALPSVSPSSSPIGFPSRNPIDVPSAEPSTLPSFSPVTDPPTEFNTWESTGICDEANIELNIKTDWKPKEISWRLTKKNDIISRVFKGDITSEFTSVKTSFCLEYDSEYKFKIWDDGDNGLNGGNITGNITGTPGYYEAYYIDDPSRSIFKVEGDFGHKKSTFFTPTRPTPSPTTLPTRKPTTSAPARTSPPIA